jgi:cytidylate kinase
MESMQALEALAQQAEIRLRTEPPGVWLNGEEVTRAIREPDVAQAASHVAAIPGVRNAMVALQRKYAREASIVMEGRDIGSVVFPNAQVKIYLDADSKVRAARRADEMEAQGQAVDRENLKKEIELRDERDRSRKVSPLLQAPDAEYLDTSKLDPDQVVSAILDIIQRKTAGRKGNAKEAK